MSRSRLRRPPGALALGLAVLVGVAGSAGVLVAAKDTHRRRRAGPPTMRRRSSRRRPTTRRPRTSCSSAPTRARASTRTTPTPAPSATPTTSSASAATRSWSCAARRDGGASLLSLPRDLWVPIAGTDQLGQDQLGLQRGPATARARRSPRRSASRSTTTSRSTSPGSRRSSTRSAVSRSASMYAAQDTQLRAPARPRVPRPRRLDGAGLRPQPALRGVDRRRLGRGDRRADLGRIERQQLFIRTTVTKLLQQIESDPFALERPHRGGDVAPCGSTRASTRSRRPTPSARPPRSACRHVHAAGRGRDEGRPDARSSCSTRRQPILDYFRGVGPRRRPPRPCPADRAGAQPYTRTPDEGPDPRRRRRHAAAADHAHAGPSSSSRSPTRRSCSTASRRWSTPGSPRSA